MVLYMSDQYFRNYRWTDARRPVPRLWIRSVLGGEGGGDVVRRMGTTIVMGGDERR